MLASRHNRVKLVKLLIAHGADVRAANKVKYLRMISRSLYLHIHTLKLTH